MRRKYRFYGEVQGVGFRYYAKRLADGQHLTGWVKNLTDGSVELEIQGREIAIENYAMQLRRYFDITKFEQSDLIEKKENAFYIVPTMYW